MADTLWVLDASIAVAWFFTDEPSRKAALAVRQDLRDRPGRYVVPHLFQAELVHVLSRKSRRDTAFVDQALRLVLRLGLRSLALSQEAVLRSISWTCDSKLSGYDATYVALAEDLGGRWLTADRTAARRVGASLATSLASWS